MAEFIVRVAPLPGARILDLGGAPETWAPLEGRYDVTLVNLPGGMETLAGAEPARRHDHRILWADACDLADILGDDSFDVVFSNSVIEHVGDASRRAAFAREVRRLAPAYWVQTPSPRFPVEPHTGVPYFFALPEEARERLIARWGETMPLYAEMVRGTTVVTREEMSDLFPDARVFSERVFGIEKSYSYYRVSREGAQGARRQSALLDDVAGGYVRAVDD